jgi:structural maintenance of chromosome 1
VGRPGGRGCASAVPHGLRPLSRLHTGLRKHEEVLRGKLVHLVKTRPRGNQDERLLADITRIETELASVRDDLVCGLGWCLCLRRSSLTTRTERQPDQGQELQRRVEAPREGDRKARQEARQGAGHAATNVEPEWRAPAQASGALGEIEGEIAEARRVIDDEEADIFGNFCERIGVGSIRDYEDTQLRYAEEEGQAKLKSDKTLARLRHQCVDRTIPVWQARSERPHRTAFETEQVQGFDDQLATLGKTISSNSDALGQLEQDKDALEQALGDLAQAVTDLAGQQTALEEALEMATTEVERIRKASSKSSAAFQRALKEISTWVRPSGAVLPAELRARAERRDREARCRALRHLPPLPA